MCEPRRGAIAAPGRGGRIRELLAIASIAGALSAGAVLAPLGLAGAVPAAVPARTYYVALGASESVGYQPSPGNGHGRRTRNGYANDLLGIERRRWPGLRLVALGCPGITAEAAVRGGGACHYAAGSEVRQAVEFIHQHRGATVLATVDLGFNDLWPCLARDRVDHACVTTALARVRRVLPAVFRQLHQAGGNRLRIVGVLHNDPYLGKYLAGRRGRAFADASIGAIDALNRALGTVYSKAGVLSADVPAAFGTGDHRLVSFRGHGRVPVDVARMCTMSWMCAPSPAGDNIHPNTAGYRAIADALAAALGSGPAVAGMRPAVPLAKH